MDTAATLPAAELMARLERLARQALPLYGHSPRAAMAMINHSENTTYRIDDPEAGAPTILRVHRVGYHSRAAIASELAWMTALRRDAGVETPEPIAARDGELIQLLRSPELPEPRHCVLFRFMEGREPPEDELLGPFERLGEVSGRIHAHSRAWAPPPAFTRHTWDFETTLGSRPIWGTWRASPGMTPDRAGLLQRLAGTIERRLARFGRAPWRWGLVHADLRLANLLVDGNHTRVIDFDDCGYSWYLYDLGTALSFIEHRADAPQLVEAWLTGYRRVIDVPAAEAAEIPTFIMLRRLLLVAWIGSHGETQLAQEQGEPYTIGTCDLAEDYLGRFA